MITPVDIANSKRKSGYDYVSTAGGMSRAANSNGKPWRAFRAAGHGKPVEFRGPRRSTPLEAAQDWCDYVNGLAVAPPQSLKTAGHGAQRGSAPRDEEVEAALGVLRDHRAQKRGRPGFVYCITDGTALKVGYSVKPEARVGELQTGNPRVLRLLAKKPGTEADERALHAKYIQDNLLQEWFRPSAELLLEFGIKEGLIA